MIYLSDEDVLLKLVAWNLFDEALSLLGAAESDVRLIDNFDRKVWSRDDWRRQYGEAVIRRAVHLAQRLPPVGDTPIEDEELARLNKVPRLDSGEAILFAATRTLPAFRVVTGDKRCLIALGASGNCGDIAARVRGNVLHLEQIILRLIEQHGVRYVRDRVRIVPDVDILIQGAFGPRGDGSRDAVCEALKQSIRRLHADCGSLLSLSDTEQPTGF